MRSSRSPRQLILRTSGVQGDTLVVLAQCPRSDSGRMRNALETARVVHVTGPSGVGKDTVVDLYCSGHLGSARCIATTTRPMRPSGSDTSRYRFVSRACFLRRALRCEFAFWQVHPFPDRRRPRYYGVSWDDLDRAREQANRIFITVGGNLGAKAVRLLFPRCLTVLLQPESGAQIVRQLHHRGTEFADQLEARIASSSTWHSGWCASDHEVVNPAGRPEEAVSAIDFLISEEWGL